MLLLLLAFAAVACSGESPAPASSATLPPAASHTPAAEVEPTPTATLPPAPGFEYPGHDTFGDYTYEDPIDFPEDLLMVVETGCTQCDDPPEALYRVWRNAGETRVDLLIDAGIVGVDGAHLTSFALRPTLHEMVVTLCRECGDQPLSSSSTSVYRSIDGGVTWREILQTEPGQVIFARAITAEGIVLERFGGGLFYYRGNDIDPPLGAEGLLPDSNRAGELRWRAEDGSAVVDARGTPIAAVAPGSYVNGLVFNPRTGLPAAIGWGIGYVSGPFEGWTVSTLGPRGGLAGFRFDTPIRPVALLGDGSILGSLSDADHRFGGIIGFIQPLTGVLTPIHGALVVSPFDPQSGRNNPVGAVEGPFLRVTADAGCVPIRANTDRRSEEITCAVDGTLVYDLRSTTTEGGLEWQRVRLLDGREGYALSRYLTK